MQARLAFSIATSLDPGILLLDEGIGAADARFADKAARRTKEMMEARVDAVFASLRNDKRFLDLTRNADGRLPMPMSPKASAEMNTTVGPH